SAASARRWPTPSTTRPASGSATTRSPSTSCWRAFLQRRSSRPANAGEPTAQVIDARGIARILPRMQELEQILALFVAAVLLAAAARRVGAPYPVSLALGGALLAFVPGVPRPSLPPELVLALFVAPVLLDAAYDTSLRDLRDNWAPVASLVIIAVGLTTAAV